MDNLPFPELRDRFRRDPASLIGMVPGVFLVDKPDGMTSHDVVDIARKRLRLRRVGHGGTLDPMATGLLLILAGNATRLFDELQTFDKVYRARLRLGMRTDTQDRTGRVLEEAPADRLPVEPEMFEQALSKYRGDIEQVPPMFSAIKKNGVPLHKLARQGKEVERQPRRVTVHALDALSFDGMEAELEMSVSKGFYVRTLIDDLGRDLGCFATMTALRRTRIGPFDLADAVTPDHIPSP